jgi:hypothetical protein
MVETREADMRRKVRKPTTAPAEEWGLQLYGPAS